MVQENCGGVAAPMGYIRQRSVDPSHYPMCRGVDGEETLTHDLSSHPELTGYGCFCSSLKRMGVYESAEFPTCPETDEDTLFVCPGFGKREKGLGSYGKAPYLLRALGDAYSLHREDGML